MPDEAVLQLATDIEGHADNVAACLTGGLTIAWDAGPVRCLRLDPAPGLTPVLCVPDVPLATEAARQVLPAVVPHADAARNAARAALLVAALTQPATDAGAACSTPRLTFCTSRTGPVRCPRPPSWSVRCGRPASQPSYPGPALPFWLCSCAG